jgi:7-cyano-7-deazaguanine synthase
MTSKKAFVLLSGGMDSTTCLHKAIVDFAPNDYEAGEIVTRLKSWPSDPFHADWVEAISVNYEQRHIKETEYAEHTCAVFGIQHTILNLKDILSGKGVMLADKDVKIPDISYDEIKGVSPTYVPFRNGTLLSLITAHAQKWVNEQISYRFESKGTNLQEATNLMKDSVGIYFGAHAEDAHNWAYPDCTPEFIGAMANAIYVGSYSCIRLITPLEWLQKDEIVTLGERLGVDWAYTWSCYAGDEEHCGTCPTCRARQLSFRKAGVEDPTVYAPTRRPQQRKKTQQELDDEIPF